MPLPFPAQILLPMSEVAGFSCPSAEVRHCYKYKGLRLAFSNMPKDASSMSTKVGGGVAG